MAKVEELLASSTEVETFHARKNKVPTKLKMIN